MEKAQTPGIGGLQNGTQNEMVAHHLPEVGEAMIPVVQPPTISLAPIAITT